MTTKFTVATSLVIISVVQGTVTLAIGQVSSGAPNAISVGQMKRQALNSAAKSESELDATQIALVSAGLGDSDPRTRETAAEAIMSRAWIARSTRSQGALAAWLRERAELAKSQPRLEEMLRADPDPKVRLQVVLALSNLEYAGSENLTLSSRLTSALAAAYDGEQEATVRNEIIKTLALTNSDLPARERTLSKALSDVSLGAVQQAVTGLSNSRSAVALPRIVRLLNHESRGIRLSVAQALAKYGNQAKPYLSEMRAAAAAETDAIVRQTLDAAVGIVEKS